MLTLLIGGARCGKSDLAVEIGTKHGAGGGDVTFIATAPRLDNDMAQRIERHRADRPAWPTIEEPLLLRDALATVPDGHLLIIDCITLWTSNASYAGWSADAVVAEAAATAAVAAKRGGHVVAVTNEVGLGVHPETDLGRVYRDLLGRVNRAWAAVAQRSLLMVAGRALPLHDPWEFLP
jgi:adenosylcobinamide kinase / adenosylcobinamide-phosphate guanylyltransferase